MSSARVLALSLGLGAASAGLVVWCWWDLINRTDEDSEDAVGSPTVFSGQVRDHSVRSSRKTENQLKVVSSMHLESSFVAPIELGAPSLILVGEGMRKKSFIARIFEVEVYKLGVFLSEGAIAALRHAKGLSLSDALSSYLAGSGMQAPSGGLNLREAFLQAKVEVQKLANEPSNEAKLRIYALYKIAETGAPPPMGKRPGLLDPIGRAKFDAWLDMARSGGVDAEMAMTKYVQLVQDLGGNVSLTAGSNISNVVATTAPPAAKQIAEIAIALQFVRDVSQHSIVNAFNATFAGFNRADVNSFKIAYGAAIGTGGMKNLETCTIYWRGEKGSLVVEKDGVLTVFNKAVELERKLLSMYLDPSVAVCPELVATVQLYIRRTT